jgi:hypothetical protein
MNPKILSALFLFVLAFASSARAQDITTGLIAHYKFNGNANDAAQHGFHLTNAGAVLTTDRFGNPNSAYSFNGSSYMKADSVHDTTFSNSQITISDWVKLDAAATKDFRIVAIGKKNTYFQYILQGFLKGSSKIFWVGTNGISSYNFYQAPTSNVSTGQWVHIACVADANKDSTLVYVNGVLVSEYESVITDLNLNNVYETIMLGASIGSGDHFTGSLDEVRIYKRALTAQDVWALYDKETSQDATGFSTSPEHAEFNLYPNPAADVLNINGNSALKSIDLISTDGRLISSYEKRGTSAEISLADIPCGLYFIRLTLMNEIQLNKKIIVSRQ